MSYEFRITKNVRNHLSLANRTCLLIVIVLLVFNQNNIYAQNHHLADTVSRHQIIQDKINTLSNDPVLANASWSCCVLSSKTGEIIASHNEEKSLIPASTMKAITTSTALSILGKDFRFSTSLKYSGEINDEGVLNGDLYIIGGGDPTFGSNRYDSLTSINSIFSIWLTKLKALNIKSIKGAIIADASIFDNQQIPYSWTWGDMGNYYASGSSGLTINENFYTIHFQPSNSIGRKASIIKINPDLPSSIDFINNVTTAKSNTGDNVCIYGGPQSNIRFLEGTVPYRKGDFEVKGSIPDPAHTCSFIFNNYLVKNQIQTSKEPTSIRILSQNGEFVPPAKLNTIAIHYSPKLDTIVYWTNTKSINTYAENILKYIGFHKHGKGSTKKGIKAVREYCKSKNINLTGFNMKDGSGLSRQNTITAKQLADIMYNMRNERNYISFYNSLPIAGKTGSLKKHFKDSHANNNLRAKTGSMNLIKSYSGYVTDINNDEYVFAIIANYYTCTKTVMRKKLVELMSNFAKSE